MNDYIKEFVIVYMNVKSAIDTLHSVQKRENKMRCEAMARLITGYFVTCKGCEYAEYQKSCLGNLLGRLLK